MLVAALLAAMVANGVPAAGAPAAGEPNLRVMTAKPLVVRGTGFDARERVRVIALGSPARVSRWTTASSTGAFKLSLGAVGTGCTRLVVTAVGMRGSHAHAAISRPACPPTPPRK